MLQRVGGSIGTAILAVVLQRALTGAHTIQAAASAYGTAFWASAILSALAIVPCVVLLRAERAATRAGLAATSPETLAEAVTAAG